ncbi:hypothetical protein [Geobacter argillaceus]|uniref:Uncharacterized protein n=1 Tax=Geobacter argillaceus TaxID=345631 RepID=A0A562VM26_9BACT|nr:hypothetical protein [Geobacter argillaceus]TWJ18841.1 hypothetical protein JN12_02290 [Geobacter argillaceus]
MIRDFFSHNFAKVREINQKYAKPNVEMSGWVRGSLLFLRLYLILLVGLLLYKFITLL